MDFMAFFLCLPSHFIFIFIFSDFIFSSSVFFFLSFHFVSIPFFYFRFLKICYGGAVTT